MALDVLTGGWVGHSFYTFKRIEESYRAGVNPIGTTLGQWGCVSNALYQSSKALEAAGVSEGLPLLVHGAAYLTPVLVNYLSVKLGFKDNPTLKKLVNLINNNFSTLCQIAIVVSSIALISIGQVALGATTLGFMAFEVLQRYCPLPVYMTKTYNTFGFFMVNFARFFLGGDIFSKITGVLDVVSYGYDWWVWMHPTTYPTPAFRSLSYTIDQARFEHEREVDPTHLHFRMPMPEIPNVDLSQIQTCYNGIDWTEPRLARLKAKVTKDPHWQENYGDGVSDAQLKAYIDEGIAQFVRNLKQRNLKNGEVQSYESLINKSKLIASRLPELEMDDQVDFLLELATVSYYCPGGYARGVNGVFLSLSDQIEEQTLPFIVHKVLEFDRRRVFEHLLSLVKQQTPGQMQALVDVEDVHVYNSMLNFFGDHFHVHGVHDPTDDPISFVPTLEKMIYDWYFGDGFKRFFEHFYTPDRIREVMETAIANRQIPDALLQQFFIEEAQSGQMGDRESAEQWMRDNVYDAIDGKIYPRYIDYLLTKAGVFKPLISS